MIVRGSDLLSDAALALNFSSVIHQTDYLIHTRDNSWTQHHPHALHVRWSDDDNERLVTQCYPQFTVLYTRMLFLPVQRTDLVRVLYLHQFGGLYVDIDYEAHTDVVAAVHASSRHSISVVRSPALMNEVMQNSLMHANASGLAFFLRCAESILEIMTFIHTGCNFSNSCAVLKLFHHRVSRTAMHVILTQYITGPAVLDKTYVKYKGSDDVGLLGSEFFHGPIAYHHQANTWVQVARAALPILSMVLVVIALCNTACLVCVARKLTRHHGADAVIEIKTD
jgi:hypothetical protein